MRLNYGVVVMLNEDVYVYNTGDPYGFNKGRSLKFHVGSRVRQTPEEGRRTYRLKPCGNKEEDNCPKTLNDKNYFFDRQNQRKWLRADKEKKKKVPRKNNNRRRLRR